MGNARSPCHHAVRKSVSKNSFARYTGVKINDAVGIDKLGLERTRLARLSVECYLQQILRHGEQPTHFVICCKGVFAWQYASIGNMHTGHWSAFAECLVGGLPERQLQVSSLDHSVYTGGTQQCSRINRDVA